MNALDKIRIDAQIKSDFVTPQTRAVLQSRLAQAEVTTPRFFNAEQFKILRAACARLIPQSQENSMIDLPGILDTTLKEGAGKGWRYNALPPDKITFTFGLAGLNETAKTLTGAAFHEISEADQDQILAAVQEGTVEGMIWDGLPAKLFFEELLAALVEIYYSHPLTKSTINDLSFADAEGWQHIGLNEIDKPQQLTNSWV